MRDGYIFRALASKLTPVNAWGSDWGVQLEKIMTLRVSRTEWKTCLRWMRKLLNPMHKLYRQTWPMCSSLSAKWPAQKNRLPVSTFLDEYTDWERRKCNLVIHNLPESTEEILADRNIWHSLRIVCVFENSRHRFKHRRHRNNKGYLTRRRKTSQINPDLCWQQWETQWGRGWFCQQPKPYRTQRNGGMSTYPLISHPKRRRKGRS